jgi:tetratricopeptide (TPR) repeat protein
MRILGPDGQPLGGGGGLLGPDGQPIGGGANDANVSDEVKEIIARAKEIAAQGDAAQALQQMVFAFQTDVSSDLVVNTTLGLLGQIAQAQGAQQSDEQQLFEQLRDNRSTPEAYFAIGYRFFQLQQMFLARPFLAKAQELLGDQVSELSQATDMHLAQASMDLGDYEGAIAIFHAMNDKYGGLPIWLLLSMGECYALSRQIDEAEAVYQIAPPEAAAQFEGLEDVREEVGDMLARVRDYDDEEMGLRAWHYVQTRGILVETNPDEKVPGERFIFFQPSEEDVAYVCGVTAAILDARGYAPTKLLWLGETSEPLARIFSQWWEIDEANVRPYQAGDNAEDEEELALLVMAHSYDVLTLPDEQSFIDLAQARAGLITFALDLRWTDRQPLTPDIAGFMSQVCNLPWEPRFNVEGEGEQQTVTQITETRDAVTIAADIASQFPKEEECDQFGNEVLEEYTGCTDLIIDHRDGDLIRRPLVTHSPIKSPRFGF